MKLSPFGFNDRPAGPRRVDTRWLCVPLGFCLAGLGEEPFSRPANAPPSGLLRLDVAMLVGNISTVTKP